jgi:dTDP-4-amino-4,6-dideoxygalactose transaminase
MGFACHEITPESGGPAVGKELALHPNQRRIQVTAGDQSPIPFVDLQQTHRLLEKELVGAFRSAVRSSQFVGGTEVADFEEEFASYCEASWSVGVNSGTDALRFAYMALGVKPGDEVVTVAHTFMATTEAITQAGGRVRFVDVDPTTMTMDPDALGAALSARTVGIVPVHLYGQPADLDPIFTHARRHGCWVVEDAAQAHGARYHGRRVGALGSLGCFSFYPGKNLGSLGEGGAVTGNAADMVPIIRRLREHGQSAKYVHDTEGYNGRLHAIQAAFLRIKLRHLDEWNAARRRVAAWYREALGGIGDLRLPVEAAGREPVYHLFVVHTPVRDRLQAFLTSRLIGTGLHYPGPLHLQGAYQSLGYGEGSLPVTEDAAATCLSLPMFPELTSSQIGRVAEAIRAFYGR